MMYFKAYLYPMIMVFSVVLCLFVLYKMLSSSRPLCNAVKSSLSGIIILFGVNLISDFTSVYLPMSIMNMGISSLAGVPGVCMLIILNMIFS